MEDRFFRPDVTFQYTADDGAKYEVIANKKNVAWCCPSKQRQLTKAEQIQVKQMASEKLAAR